MDNLLKDEILLRHTDEVSKAHIEQLLMFHWLITGSDIERQLMKEYAKSHQQERYAYILMER